MHMDVGNEEFLPILLGSEVNAYVFARSFHEKYNIRTLLLDTYHCAGTYYSDLIEIELDENFKNDDVFVYKLLEIAGRYKNRKKLLLACSDKYVELLTKHREELKDAFVIPYISYELRNELSNKSNFYKLCDKYHIEYPNTVVCNKKNWQKIKIPFDFPVIIKPTNSAMYFELNFPGKLKVYRANNSSEFTSIIKAIYNSKYTDELIIQEYITGDDTHERLLNVYCDNTGKVKKLCMRQVLLEEWSSHGIGSAAATINVDNEDITELLEKVKELLEDNHYIGFANFDFKLDPKDNKYKAFEINLRLGRSGYFITADGANVSELYVDDFLLNKEIEFEIKEANLLCSLIPLDLLFKYSTYENKKRIEKLVLEHKYVNPLRYDRDSSQKRLEFLEKMDLYYYEMFREFNN